MIHGFLTNYTRFTVFNIFRSNRSTQGLDMFLIRREFIKNSSFFMNRTTTDYK